MAQFGTFAYQMDDGRRAERLVVNMRAMVRETGLSKFEVSLLDLSVTGFRFKTSFNLHIGSRIWLSLPKLEGRQAEVRWRDGFIYGCAYDQPLHVAVFNHLVRYYSR